MAGVSPRRRAPATRRGRGGPGAGARRRIAGVDRRTRSLRRGRRGLRAGPRSGSEPRARTSSYAALGAQQELWIHRHLDLLRPAIGPGGGREPRLRRRDDPRAPRWMSRSGLEWLHWLSREPRRLWRRYLVGRGVRADLVRTWSEARSGSGEGEGEPRGSRVAVEGQGRGRRSSRGRRSRSRSKVESRSRSQSRSRSHAVGTGGPRGGQRLWFPAAANGSGATGPAAPDSRPCSPPSTSAVLAILRSPPPAAGSKSSNSAEAPRLRPRRGWLRPAGTTAIRVERVATGLAGALGVRLHPRRRRARDGAAGPHPAAARRRSRHGRDHAGRGPGEGRAARDRREIRASPRTGGSTSTRPSRRTKG